MIEIKNLTKTYISNGETVEALKNINLTINDGDIFGIIGMSGAGKSTLVRCINYLEQPSSGNILIDGEDITKANGVDLMRIRRKVSMVFQQFNLLQQRTVLKNVEIAGEITGDKNRREKAIELLSLVGLKDKLNAYPSNLSGGQQQRVAIARALMTNPKVLLSDEATSALDPETTASILELFKKLNKEMNLTIIIISHQMSVIEAVCNKAAMISHSEIVASGDIKDIFLFPKNSDVKKLVYSGHITGFKNQKLIKLMFCDDVDRPLISDIIRNLNISLSILYGETKMLGGKYYGQTIFNLTDYDKDIERLKNYMNVNNIMYEEVDSNELF